MFNNGSQFVGLTPPPIKSKIIFSIRALHLWQTRIYLRSALSEISISLLFQLARCEVIVKYTNCNLLEHERIRTGIKTLEAQIDEKNKNIEARQNFTGSYKKRVYVYMYICYIYIYVYTYIDTYTYIYIYIYRKP